MSMSLIDSLIWWCPAANEMLISIHHVSTFLPHDSLFIRICIPVALDQFMTVLRFNYTNSRANYGGGNGFLRQAVRPAAAMGRWGDGARSDPVWVCVSRWQACLIHRSFGMLHVGREQRRSISLSHTHTCTRTHTHTVPYVNIHPATHTFNTYEYT